MQRLRGIRRAAGASLLALGTAGGGPPDGISPAPAAAPAGPTRQDQSTLSFHHDHILGTSLDLWVVTPRTPDAERGEQAILDEIERLRRVFSTYDPDSELSRLNRAAGPVLASPDLL